ncbi:multiheme c-type cytochrome [Mucilaginibacter gynuensis]|uniref:Multiheme c-type cytochrome n=1 Tax=Mucilaginibacter gynuensis TaxID=1302236 RepID=A0ABP8G6Y4_9SPHI
MKRKRILLLCSIFLVPLVLIFSQCDKLNKKDDPRGELYAGSATCIRCHKDVYTNYLHTAHFKSTREAEATTTHGDFARNNTFVFNAHSKVVMEKRAGGLYQVGYTDGKKTDEQRFDITFGGVKAETYLYWKNNQIYQLPVSYFSKLHGWANSPGYDTTQVNFTRIIGKRCFECHASYIKELPAETQSLSQTVEFDKASLINGVDCERCHGPAANHVNFHTDFPEEKKPKYIARYAELTRGQRIDMCAVCHSGNKNMIITTTFNFKPGDKLANFVEPDFEVNRNDNTLLDVHGNQSQLLALSQCFIKSKMDCATCHNTHVNEEANLSLDSKKCMSCHSDAGHNFCKMADKIGPAIKNNCIDCHMPERSSNIIAVETAGAGKTNPYMVRTHRIAVYPDQTEKVLAYLKSSKNLSKN